MKLIDLSHPIISKPPCTFTSVDMVPKVSFEEGESQGTNFVTSCVDNQHANLCTHIDFPGHLADFGNRFAPSVGLYPIERFVGNVAVLDFSSKLGPVRRCFDSDGRLTIRPDDGERMLALLRSMRRFEISAADLIDALDRLDATDLTGILLYTGLSEFWKYEVFEAWQYLYFYNLFCSVEACYHLRDLGISFVGIDALQRENPVINFRGDELPIILHEQCRRLVMEALSSNERHPNHHILLGGDVLIYENLKIPKALTSRVLPFAGVPLNFQFDGVNDNAMVRPYVTVEG